MIHYLIENNPDSRVIDMAVQALHAGKLISFATPTGWCFACSPHEKKGVDKLYQIKRAQKNKHFSLICRDLTQLSKYAVVPNHFFKAIRKLLPGPYTFILNPTTNIPTAIKQYWKQREVGVRVIGNVTVNEILEKLKAPMMVGSVTAELFQKNSVEAEMPILSYLIEDEFDHALDLIIDDGQEVGVKPSSVIDLTDEYDPKVVREGAGDISFFTGLP